MRILLPALLITLVFVSCDSMGKQYPSRMREPEPVVVNTPEESKPAIDSTKFLIVLEEMGMHVRYEGRTAEFIKNEQLDSMIKQERNSIREGDVVVESHLKKSTERVKGVVEVLKQNNIFRFQLVTDLEKSK